MAKTFRLKQNLFLITVFILAVVLRFYRLSDLPQGFDGDESAFGYYAFSLLRNGTDEFGNKFPLYFPSIGDYKYPAYSYLSVLPVATFGLNVFSTRFLSAFLGSLLAIVIYFLSQELFNKKRISGFAAFLTAISPYGILFSRKAFEANIATFFLAFGVLLLLRYIRLGERKNVLLALVLLLISVYSYSAVRLFLIIFLPYVFLVFRNTEIHRGRKRAFTGVLIVVLLVSLLSFFDPRGRVRAESIGFLQDFGPKDYLATSIHDDGIAMQGKNILITRAIHNKLTSYVLFFGERYLEHLNPVYLFFTGNPNMPKYFVPNSGLFYFVEFLTMLLGIYGLGKLKTKYSLILVGWLLISIVPSSLTIETPNPVRTLIGLPMFVILSAVGIWTFSNLLPAGYKRISYIAIFLIFVSNLFYFWHQYTVHDYYHEPWYSDEKVGEMVSSVSKVQNDFEKVVVPNDPYIHFLFFNKVLPKDFLRTAKIEPEILGKWERVDEFGNIIFKMPYSCPKIGRERVLYVCKGEEVPQNSIVHDVVRFEDGKPAYLLVEFVPYSKRKQGELPDRVHYMIETDLSFKEALLDETSGRYW